MTLDSLVVTAWEVVALTGIRSWVADRCTCTNVARDDPFQLILGMTMEQVNDFPAYHTHHCHLAIAPRVAPPPSDRLVEWRFPADPWSQSLTSFEVSNRSRINPDIDRDDRQLLTST